MRAFARLCHVVTERKRNQQSRLIETGARLRIDGLLHVQKRGSVGIRYPLPLPLPSQTISADDKEVDLASSGFEEKISNTELPSYPPEGSHEAQMARIIDREVGLADGENKIFSKARGAYSKEELAERMMHLLARR